MLKEVNGGSGWSLCDHLRGGGREQEHDVTWDNIARWTEGILNLPYEIPWLELEKDCYFYYALIDAVREILKIEVK